MVMKLIVHVLILWFSYIIHIEAKVCLIHKQMILHKICMGDLVPCDLFTIKSKTTYNVYNFMHTNLCISVIVYFAAKCMLSPPYWIRFSRTCHVFIQCLAFISCGITWPVTAGTSGALSKSSRYAYRTSISLYMKNNMNHIQLQQVAW